MSLRKRLLIPTALIGTVAASSSFAGETQSCRVASITATAVSVHINEVRFANPVPPEVARAHLEATAEALTAAVLIMANAFRAADTLAGQPSGLRSHLDASHRAFDGFRYCTLGEPIGDGCPKPAAKQPAHVQTAGHLD